MMDIDKKYTIQYDTMNENQWGILAEIYEEMPGFLGYRDNCPSWFGFEDDENNIEENNYLWASVEPSGLQVVGRLPPTTWREWDTIFMATASQKLGFPVRDAEE